MKHNSKILILLALALAIGFVLFLKQQEPVSELPASASQSRVENSQPLPRLVDLGANKCIPCKAMAPILDELKVTYSSQFEVEFIDVWKNKEAGERYGVKMIPTQIFYSADGKELFRHEGFFSREKILAQWERLGVTLPEPTPK